MLLGVPVGRRTVNAEADAVIGLGKILEEVKVRVALPRLQINFLSAANHNFLHALMLNRRGFSALLTRRTFTGTDRGLLRSVLGPWSPVLKCEAPGAPISVEEHTSMAPRPRRQSQNPPLQKSSAIPALPWPSKPRLRYPPGLAPTTRLNALLNAASDS